MRVQYMASGSGVRELRMSRAVEAACGFANRATSPMKSVIVGEFGGCGRGKWRPHVAPTCGGFARATPYNSAYAPASPLWRTRRRYNPRLLSRRLPQPKQVPCPAATSTNLATRSRSTRCLSPATSNSARTATGTSISRWSFPTARGSIAARMWNANEAVYKSFDNGDYVRVEGTAQLYQGAMQIIATKLHQGRSGRGGRGRFHPLAGRGRR